MADLLIKGMKMPENCAKCPFSEADYGYCTADIRLRDAGYVEQRPEWCPLVEIPKHGRLIDAGELCKGLLERWETADKNAESVISQVMSDIVTPIVIGTPTVIEAREGGEQDA